MSLRQAQIGNWEPKQSWTKEFVNYYSIIDCETELRVMPYSVTNKQLSFPTKEMAEEFLECFKDLIEEARDLL